MDISYCFCNYAFIGILELTTFPASAANVRFAQNKNSLFKNAAVLVVSSYPGLEEYFPHLFSIKPRSSSRWRLMLYEKSVGICICHRPTA